MSAWPDDLNVAPIGQWPGVLRDPHERRPSPFRANLGDTLARMRRELLLVTDTRAQRQSAELLIAIRPGGFRIDGRPRADARAEHPGVILSVDSRHGHLSYPCDTFDDWQDNLRGIVLALEALRKVDRYGVTSHGEQYRGFLAIEAAPAQGFEGALEALAFLEAFVGDADGLSLAQLIREAKRRSHPDTAGPDVDPTAFGKVVEAERVINGGGGS